MGSNLDRVLSSRNSGKAHSKIGLEPPGTHTPSAWFLGPNAENLDIMRELVAIALEDHAQARKDYSRVHNDPDMVAGRDPAFEPTVEAMKRNLQRITAELRGSIPLSSHRNQSHMYWDITMPGAVGYFAGMLFNQNNVAAEASPVTTALEIRAARELCTMLGFAPDGAPEPWGHITCDGSVANLEAMWAARNLKYQAVALARAIRVEPALEHARGFGIRKPDGSWAPLLDLSLWELLNLDVDDALAIPHRLMKEAGIADVDVQAAIDTYTIQAKGAVEFDAEMLHGAVQRTPAILVPATAHYSWMKGAAILGLGTKAVRFIPVDLDGRMKLSELAKALNECLEEKRPVAQVVAVMGSTGESAVDPLADILDLRRQFAARGLTFALHLDAAWGGYFASMLRDAPPSNAPPDGEQTGFDDVPVWSLSDYVRRQFAHLGEADTITVDPHKAGFIPYPAGALCYRNKEMIFLVSLTSPVVYHGGDAPTVGVYGVEGSKPGAAAVGVALSHITIPPDTRGYGRLLGRCAFNAKRFYAALTTLPARDDDFVLVPFQRLPAEKAGKTATEIEREKDLIRAKIVEPKTNNELRAIFDDEPEILDLFQSLGPDLNVFCYAFNFKVDGKLNTRIDLMNEFNNALFHRMSHEVPEVAGEVPSNNLFVTSSSFDGGVFGADFMRAFARRAGVRYRAGATIQHLISTMQNPFLTATSKGNFIPTLMEVFRETVEEERRKIIARHGLGQEG